MNRQENLTWLLVQLRSRRFLACARCKLWWMTPEWGSRALDIPPETQFLLLEVEEGGPYAIALPLIDNQTFRGTLRGPRRWDFYLSCMSHDLWRISCLNIFRIIIFGACSSPDPGKLDRIPEEMYLTRCRLITGCMAIRTSRQETRRWCCALRVGIQVWWVRSGPMRSIWLLTQTPSPLWSERLQQLQPCQVSDNCFTKSTFHCNCRFPICPAQLHSPTLHNLGM